MRTAMYATVLVLVCALMGHAAPPAWKKANGASHVKGGVTVALIGDAVEMTASGDGIGGPWGRSAVTATWAPSLDDVLAVLSGEVDELTINTGTFAAVFPNGAIISGPLTGTVRPRGDGNFGLEATFTVTSAGGAYAGASGGGTLRAVLDLETLEFRGTLQARLTVPR